MALTKELRAKYFCLLLLPCLILTCYASTFYATWHLDDLPNIVDNPAVHLKDLSFASLGGALTANPVAGAGKSLYRPVSMLSFALNWYISGNNTFSYHVVNIAIHIISAFVLYQVILLLLTSTSCSTKNSIPSASAQYTALLGAMLWALSPIQTMAVTYIVQRMASMAAMFYLIAMYFYLYGRSAVSLRTRIISFIMVVICFLLAVLSKENAFTLPIALLLLELLFLQDLSQKIFRQRFAILLLATSVALLLICSLLYFNGNPLSFLNLYNDRPFTLVERLLTEPRVVTTYLYQIYCPLTAHLSFDHDFSISRSLLDPWTTLPAILTLVLFLASGLLSVRKAPLYSFAVLFFFLNHVLESTVLPLELIFEHRNYLPSMFLFAPIAYVLISGITHFRNSSIILPKALIAFSFLLVVAFASSTISRNKVYITEGSLWEDTFSKAPKSARVAHNLGRWYRQNYKFTRALVYFKLAEQFSDRAARPGYTKANALNGQGTIYYFTDSPARAIAAFREALVAFPDFEASQKNLVLTFVQIKQWAEALQESSILVDKYGDNPEYLYIHAVLLLRNGKPEAGKSYIETARRKAPDIPKFLLANAAICKALKQYQEAKDYLYQYDTIRPGGLAVWLALLEISILEQDDALTDKMKTKIQSKYNEEQLTKAFAQTQTIPLYANDIVMPALDLDFSVGGSNTLE